MGLIRTFDNNISMRAFVAKLKEKVESVQNILQDKSFLEHEFLEVDHNSIWFRLSTLRLSKTGSGLSYVYLSNMNLESI